MDDTTNNAPVIDTVKSAGLKLFDQTKSKIFWVALGFAACLYMNRKK
jgi:hypothetical protein